MTTRHAATLRSLAARLRTTSMPLADIILTLQQAADHVDALTAQRDAARQALNGLLNVINHDDDGGWFICAEAEPVIDKANRVSVALAGAPA